MKARPELFSSPSGPAKRCVWRVWSTHPTAGDVASAVHFLSREAAWRFAARVRSASALDRSQWEVVGCHRCCGEGRSWHWHPHQGVCYRCGGSGNVSRPKPFLPL